MRLRCACKSMAVFGKGDEDRNELKRTVLPHGDELIALFITASEEKTRRAKKRSFPTSVHVEDCVARTSLLSDWDKI